MCTNSSESIEYIWLKKLVNYFDVLHLGPRVDLMEPAGSPISVFSYLNAVRTHKAVAEVEKCRLSLQTESGENAYSLSDGLKYAIMYGHSTYSEFLLRDHLEKSLSNSVCCPLLLLAIRLDAPEIVEQLCKFSSCNSTYRDYVNKPGCSAMECGRTALHIAAETGNLACTKILLRYGAATEATDDFGHTPVTRILEKLKSPHINSKTIKCLIELFNCRTYITQSEIQAFNRIVDSCIVKLDIASEWLEMEPGPFSLKHMCRCQIRKDMMYPSIPEKLQSLGLPRSLVHYLSLTCQ